MSSLLVILGVPLAVVVLVLKGLAVDEVRGRIERRITDRLEATIASIGPELQAAWGDEWRAELATVIKMPVTAAGLVRGLRAAARQLSADHAEGDVPSVEPRAVGARMRTHAQLKVDRHSVMDRATDLAALALGTVAVALSNFAMGDLSQDIVLVVCGCTAGSQGGGLALAQALSEYLRFCRTIVRRPSRPSSAPATT